MRRKESEMSREIDIEDFDVWQDERSRITADAATYKMIRDIAVDFANAMLKKTSGA